MIDCHTLEVTHVAVPTDVDVVVRFVAHRTLVGSAYSDRVGRVQSRRGGARATADRPPWTTSTRRSGTR